MVAILEAPYASEPLQAANTRQPGDFPEDEFVTIPNVPVFAEHETKSRDGREIRFGPEELKLLCDRCNRRIAESGDYAAVCIGHTPSPHAKAAGASDPDVVGFAGPFRMGLIGEAGARQRNAILADFHIFRGDVAQFKKHPRRSAELWLEDSYDEMFLDPIALLGAETPRLDLGLLYSAELHRGRQRVRLEKYSAAVMPEAGNVFIPDGECNDRQPYRGDTAMHVDSDTIAQIVEAITQTDEWQYLRKIMSETPGDASGGEAAVEGVAPNAGLPEPTAEVAEPPAPPAEPTANPPAPEEDLDPLKARKYEALDEMDDDELEQYMAHRKSRYEASSSGEYQTANESELGSQKIERAETTGAPTPYQAEGTVIGDSKNPSGDGVVVESKSVADGAADPDEGGKASSEPYSRNGESLHYQRMQVEIRKLQDSNKEMRDALQQEKYSRADSERYNRLQELVLNGYALDPDKEMKRLSSRVVNDELFEENITSMTENYQRVPTMSLPYSRSEQAHDPSRPGSANERMQYSKRCAEIATKVCNQRIEQGDQVDYIQVLEEVKAGKHGDVAA